MIVRRVRDLNKKAGAGKDKLCPACDEAPASLCTRRRALDTQMEPLPRLPARRRHRVHLASPAASDACTHTRAPWPSSHATLFRPGSFCCHACGTDRMRRAMAGQSGISGRRFRISLFLVVLADDSGCPPLPVWLSRP
jgi:hypothetical protein